MWFIWSADSLDYDGKDIGSELGISITGKRDDELSEFYFIDDLSLAVFTISSLLTSEPKYLASF